MVYLIHPYFIVLVTYSYTSMLAAVGCPVLDYRNHSFLPVNAYYVSPLRKDEAEGLMWGCFFYTLFVTQAIVWPLAWMICKLPRLNRVL
mgnify:CR=1 FL=1